MLVCAILSSIAYFFAPLILFLLTQVNHVGDNFDVASLKHLYSHIQLWSKANLSVIFFLFLYRKQRSLFLFCSYATSKYSTSPLILFQPAIVYAYIGSPSWLKVCRFENLRFQKKSTPAKVPTYLAIGNVPFSSRTLTTISTERKTTWGVTHKIIEALYMKGFTSFVIKTS